MQRAIIGTVAVLCAAATVAADRPPPPVLAPVGPWVVEAEPDTCFVRRSYGPADRRIVVAFQPVFNNERMDIIVITPGGGDQRTGDAKLTPGPSGATITGDYASVRVTGKPERFTRITTDRALLDTLQTAGTLSIRARPVDVTIRLTAFAKAMKAYEECQQGMLRSWGVDPASATPERQPKPHAILRYFGTGTYPSEAINSGIIGRVVAVLQVDVAGKVTACRITASAGQVLNAGTCRQAMKIPFDPGTDANGRPAPSIYVLTVRWTM